MTSTFFHPVSNSLGQESNSLFTQNRTAAPKCEKLNSTQNERLLNFLKQPTFFGNIETLIGFILSQYNVGEENIRIKGGVVTSLLDNVDWEGGDIDIAIRFPPGVRVPHPLKMMNLFCRIRGFGYWFDITHGLDMKKGTGQPPEEFYNFRFGDLDVSLTNKDYESQYRGTKDARELSIKGTNGIVYFPNEYRTYAEFEKKRLSVETGCSIEKLSSLSNSTFFYFNDLFLQGCIENIDFHKALCQKMVSLYEKIGESAFDDWLNTNFANYFSNHVEDDKRLSLLLEIAFLSHGMLKQINSTNAEKCRKSIWKHIYPHLEVLRLVEKNSFIQSLADRLDQSPESLSRLYNILHMQLTLCSKSKNSAFYQIRFKDNEVLLKNADPQGQLPVGKKRETLFLLIPKTEMVFKKVIDAAGSKSLFAPLTSGELSKFQKMNDAIGNEVHDDLIRKVSATLMWNLDVSEDLFSDGSPSELLETWSILFQKWTPTVVSKREKSCFLNALCRLLTIADLFQIESGKEKEALVDLYNMFFVEKFIENGSLAIEKYAFPRETKDQTIDRILLLATKEKEGPKIKEILHQLIPFMPNMKSDQLASIWRLFIVHSSFYDPQDMKLFQVLVFHPSISELLFNRLKIKTNDSNKVEKESENSKIIGFLNQYLETMDPFVKEENIVLDLLTQYCERFPKLVNQKASQIWLSVISKYLIQGKFPQAKELLQKAAKEKWIDDREIQKQEEILFEVEKFSQGGLRMVKEAIQKLLENKRVDLKRLNELVTYWAVIMGQKKELRSEKDTAAECKILKCIIKHFQSLEVDQFKKLQFLVDQIVEIEKEKYSLYLSLITKLGHDKGNLNEESVNTIWSLYKEIVIDDQAPRIAFALTVGRLFLSATKVPSAQLVRLFHDLNSFDVVWSPEVKKLFCDAFSKALDCDEMIFAEKLGSIAVKMDFFHDENLIRKEFSVENLEKLLNVLTTAIKKGEGDATLIPHLLTAILKYDSDCVKTNKNIPFLFSKIKVGSQKELVTMYIHLLYRHHLISHNSFSLLNGPIISNLNSDILNKLAEVDLDKLIEKSCLQIDHVKLHTMHFILKKLKSGKIKKTENAKQFFEKIYKNEDVNAKFVSEYLAFLVKNSSDYFSLLNQELIEKLESPLLQQIFSEVLNAYCNTPLLDIVKVKIKSIIPPLVNILFLDRKEKCTHQNVRCIYEYFSKETESPSLIELQMLELAAATDIPPTGEQLEKINNRTQGFLHYKVEAKCSYINALDSLIRHVQSILGKTANQLKKQRDVKLLESIMQLETLLIWNQKMAVVEVFQEGKTEEEYLIFFNRCKKMFLNLENEIIDPFTNKYYLNWLEENVLGVEDQEVRCKCIYKILQYKQKLTGSHYSQCDIFKKLDKKQLSRDSKYFKALDDLYRIMSYKTEEKIELKDERKDISVSKELITTEESKFIAECKELIHCAAKNKIECKTFVGLLFNDQADPFFDAIIETFLKKIGSYAIAKVIMDYMIENRADHYIRNFIDRIPEYKLYVENANQFLSYVKSNLIDVLMEMSKKRNTPSPVDIDILLEGVLKSRAPSPAAPLFVLNNLKLNSKLIEEKNLIKILNDLSLFDESHLKELSESNVLARMQILDASNHFNFLDKHINLMTLILCSTGSERYEKIAMNLFSPFCSEYLKRSGAADLKKRLTAFITFMASSEIFFHLRPGVAGKVLLLIKKCLDDLKNQKIDLATVSKELVEAMTGNMKLLSYDSDICRALWRLYPYKDQSIKENDKIAFVESMTRQVCRSKDISEIRHCQNALNIYFPDFFLRGAGFLFTAYCQCTNDLKLSLCFKEIAELQVAVLDRRLKQENAKPEEVDEKMYRTLETYLYAQLEVLRNQTIQENHQALLKTYLEQFETFKQLIQTAIPQESSRFNEWDSLFKKMTIIFEFYWRKSLSREEQETGRKSFDEKVEASKDNLGLDYYLVTKTKV